MKKFIVDGFTEYSRSFLVETNTAEEAVKIVENMFFAGQISRNDWEWGDTHFEPAHETEESMQSLVKIYEEQGVPVINR